MAKMHELYKKRSEEEELLQDLLKDTLSQKADIFFYKKKDELLTQMIHSFQQQSQKMIQLDNIKNRFLGIASHELKNNLNIIQNYAELFLSFIKNGYKDEYKQFIETILETAKETTNILNDYLDISSIEQGKIALKIEDFDIEEIVSKSCLLNEGIALKKNITLHFTVQPAIPKMHSDPYKILQILNNLLSNAIKYSPENSDVFVKVQQKEGFIVITVEDQGQGISKDEIKKLFEPFTQISSQPTSGEKKTGLGLFIVKKLVHLLEGNIEVASELGKGTVFQISFPSRIS
jgi:signal transduction histidine kinase